MIEIDFKEKYYPLVLVLFVAGYMGAIFLNIYFDWLAMLTAGIISLVMLYGFSNLKLFFQPLPSPKWRIVVKYVLLLLVLEVTAIVVIAIINSHALLSFHNTTLTTSSTGRDYPLIERVWIAFTLLVSLVGEEVGMASISIPLIRLLSQTQLKKYAWPIINVLGCIVFACLHLPHYHFNWLYPLIVGITRYPITASWRSANTLRSGIYVHWISDAVLIIGTLI
ncbi:bacteriocin immunity protein [Lactiplantibacillus plantarum]|uniref:bacteriocin immunity protein n=1 Tax=Lactiplantibacillus plantarum TaxID=1590 RepID=UPI0024A785B1|nr:bacteriocin immunity protein [Lactiplantibacillus plantarum]MDI5786174.1 bacteriocin immunity protein [Lactiplantibacillus plantarum]